MKVARYEVPGQVRSAWNRQKIWPRPAGTVEIGLRRKTMCAEFHVCPESGVPPGREPSSYAIQAINCLATIVKSLRDKKPTQLLRSSTKLAPIG
jgi:hypothetical protein